MLKPGETFTFEKVTDSIKLQPCNHVVAFKYQGSWVVPTVSFTPMSLRLEIFKLLSFRREFRNLSGEELTALLIKIHCTEVL